jgi:hypothetical protein
MARATRARRRELLAIAHAGRPLVSLPAPALEWLFWDVRDWVRALPRDHANVAIAAELEARIDTEYARRDRQNPTGVTGAEAAEVADRMVRRFIAAALPAPSHHEPARLIPFPARAHDDKSNPS